MPFNEDGFFDIAEALRVIDLADDQADIVMGIRTNIGNFVEGEGRRTYQFEDSVKGDNTPPQMSILGYFFDGGTRLLKDKKRHRSVTIVKHTDFATPTLFQLVGASGKSAGASNKHALVIISRYHAGGTKSIKEQQPVLQIWLLEATIQAISTFSSSRNRVPYDIVTFGFDRMEIHARQQFKDGSMGPELIQVVQAHDTEKQKPRKK